MIVKVEACWNGNNHYTFRLTMPDGSREYVTGLEWTRTLASNALTMLENVYGYNRRRIRFSVH
jgi:hypothetical protein